jgi:hypothetical protein
VTTFAQERPAIESRFATLFTSAPIAFENAPDSPALAAAKAAGDPWVRLTIVNGESRTAGIAGPGDVLVEHAGRIVVQVFVRDGTGTATARGLADAAAAVFQHARFEGIRSYSAGVNAIGNDGHGYYQINVSTPYRRFTN